VDVELRFFLRHNGNVAGPLSDDDVRDAFRDGRLEPGTRVRLAGSDLWLPPAAFATFAVRRDSLPPPDAPVGAPPAVDAGLAATGGALRELLMYWLREGGRTTGPFVGEHLRRALQEGRHRDAIVHVVDFADWMPIVLIFPSEPALATDPPRSAELSPPSVPTPIARCPICLERVVLGAEVCTECGEPWTSTGPRSAGEPSIPDDRPGASWLAMHWRPLVTLGAMLSIVVAGVTLRYLAPDRFSVASANKQSSATVTPTRGCGSACWNGESCESGKCVWQKPNDVKHVAAATAPPTLDGPFPLPRDVSDALPLDAERFAVALLSGMQVQNARTGGVLSLLTEAPQIKKLFRVGSTVYATSAQRIYVVDAASTQLLKTIELGAPAAEVVVGASGRRALASLPSAHAVAILATEYHAEIDRIPFGDDAVGPIGVDDTGMRALTTTGQVPLAGWKEPQGGAVYAFDPSRLASAQDRVRASVVGNPVAVLMTPDGLTSWVVLRAEGALAPLAWLKSGAVRQEARIPTCKEPEQIELLRKDRRAIVRCNEGRAVDIIDLTRRELVKRVEFNARVAHIAVSPDGEQAIAALPADGAGFIGLVDLKTFAVRMTPVTAEPTRVRYSPDGAMAVVVSDKAKTAWVIR
jgi:DNA-binding beta-propeller fold protein YncE